MSDIASSANPLEPIPEEEVSEDFVLFLDYNFGRKVVPRALREIGIRCEPHLDHFAQDAPDIEWLPEVGERGWFIVTKDEMIGRRILELEALRNAKAGVFVLASNNLTGPQMAAALIAVVPKMKKFVQDHEKPFIAKFYKNGHLTPWK